MSSTVAQIRQLLDKRDGLSPQSMQPLAAAYHEEVIRINQRLREGSQLLRKGLRSEAIQRVSLHPNAMEGAADLDFPEIEDWLEILQFFGIPVPPELDRDAVEQLNEAIVDTQPLAALLKQHRRLAIARAPLAWRLKVLRRLAALDPTSGVWEEDLEVWEEARLKQLPAELKAAVASEDLNNVASICEELTAPHWRNRPNSELIKQARAAFDRFTYSAQCAELRALAPRLHEAFSQFNEAEARGVREEWRQIQYRMTHSLPTELAEQAEPALLWLEEIDREAALRHEREVAIERLEAALHAEAPLADLQRAFHQTTRFDEPLSAELQQRFRVAVEERQLVSKRKSQAVFAGIVAATLVIAGALAYWQFREYRNEKVATARDLLKSLLDQQKLDEAAELWRHIEAKQPDIATDTQLTSLTSRLSAMLADEASRAEQFARYLQQADNQDASGIDLSSLARAEKLAANEEEKAAAFRLRRRRSQWEREISEEHSQSVAAVLDEIRGELDQFESVQVENITSAEFAPLIDRLRNLEAEFPRRNSSADVQIDAVRSRAVAMQRAVEELRQAMERESRAFDRLADATSLHAFVQSLEAFARDAPRSVVAEEFAQAASEKPLWHRALAWNDFVDSLASALAAGITPDKANSLLARYTELAQDVEQNPAESLAGKWRSQLETVGGRTKVLDQVFGSLPQSVVADLVTVVDSSNTRFFINKDYRDRFQDRFSPDNRAQTSIDVVATESGAVAGRTVAAPLIVTPEPHATILWLSGLGKSGRQDFLTGWESKLLRTMAELRTRDHLDGAVKEMLLLHLLEGACEGSLSLRAQLSSELEFLRSRGEARKQWFAPGPVNNSLDREVEVKVIKRLSTIYRENPARLVDLHQTAESKYQWVGFLTRDASGAIACHMNESPNSPGVLLVVRTSLTNPGLVTWSPIGRWEADRVTLDKTSGDLTAGRPIFLLNTPKTTGS